MEDPKTADANGPSEPIPRRPALSPRSPSRTLLRFLVATAANALLLYTASVMHWGLHGMPPNAPMSLPSESWRIFVWNHLDADTTRLAVVLLCFIAVGWRWREQRLADRATGDCVDALAAKR